MRSPSDLADAFRSSGRKLTPQRERIFRVLHGNPTHPTAEAVHAEVVADMPSVSLRTVYATLHDLAEMGELVQLDLGTGSSRFDPNVSEHHHLVCDGCGRVQDIDLPVPAFELDADAARGFHVDATQIVLRGRCATCSDPAVADPRPTHKQATEERSHA
jgi:Fur family peroxide stress response transcriptional regulator